MTKPRHSYKPEYFNEDAASVVVPMLLEMFNPASVVDVGCGIGTWLKVFQRHGVTDVLGLDADHVSPENLLIDTAAFVTCNLEHPPGLQRRFDLCLSLEVGEHLPPEAAEGYVGFLVSLADVVIFSAAIPGQTGQHHVNPQWPSYWAAKFKAHGFGCYDQIRRRIWVDERVHHWYRQNILVFAKPEAMSTGSPEEPLSLIHPGLWMKQLARYELARSQRAKPALLLRILRRLSRRPTVRTDS